MKISFNHIINPFPSGEETEHGIASKITYASLEVAVQQAKTEGVDVQVSAVLLKGDELSVKSPAILAGVLKRTVQDLYNLRPKKPLPLISDILNMGALSFESSHIIYTNMDIAVQPNFYIKLREVIENFSNENSPFIIYRRNIPSNFNSIDQLSEMYTQEGTISEGFDCFVFSF